MASLDLMRRLHRQNITKLVLLILDGLGGLPLEESGPTELEAARTPNLDRLARRGTLGQIVPVRPGITPGSGPAHLSLFGYDPVVFDIGRGVLEALGIGMEVAPGDVAARGNLCTLDAEGRIIDRRAGRIPSEEATPLVERLNEIRLPGVEVEARVAREYRFAVVMRGEGLSPEIADTDPQQVGVPPLPARPLKPEADRAAELFNAWIEQARKVLADHPRANGLTLRGFSSNPNLPSFAEVYGLRAACVAVYPMYRGVSRLVGMEVLPLQGETPADEFTTVATHWQEFDFFFIHIKKTDSLGEDGDFAGKVAYIEHIDAALPELLALQPDVLAVTGDHSTPARLRSHSWHPVPLLLWAPASGRPDPATSFGEQACATGGLGTLPSTDLMPLLLAHAGRLKRYGA